MKLADLNRALELTYGKGCHVFRTCGHIQIGVTGGYGISAGRIVRRHSPSNLPFTEVLGRSVKRVAAKLLASDPPYDWIVGLLSFRNGLHVNSHYEDEASANAALAKLRESEPEQWVKCQPGWGGSLKSTLETMGKS